MPKNKKANDEKYLLYIDHGDQYTDLLRFYIKNVRMSNILKIIFKISFFIIIILIMVGLSVFFGYSIYNSFNIIDNLNIEQDNSAESIIGVIGTLIPSFVTLLVSIIKLPEIIAKYLFNRKEEEHMADIIEKIQNYDIQMYALERERDVKKLLMKQWQGKQSNEIPDKVFEGNAEQPSDDLENNQQDSNIG